MLAFWASSSLCCRIRNRFTSQLFNSLTKMFWNLKVFFSFSLVPLTANPVMNWYEAICSPYLSHHNDLQQKYQCVWLWYCPRPQIHIYYISSQIPIGMIYNICLWCFWTVVLEKTLESPLDCKEIQPVHPKGNSNTLATWCRELTHLKRPWCWEILRPGREGDDSLRLHELQHARPPCP